MECPHCHNQINVVTTTYDIPYFGKVFQSTVSCSCGYKFVDVFPFEEKEPSRYCITISESELNSRVVKSSTCTVKIPELGIRVDPGPASQGRITNVEGILRWMEDAIQIAIHWGDNTQKKKGKEILKELRSACEGSQKVTLVLEDHRGFSCIISEKAQKEVLYS
ncbi:MAG: ZPR1 zinc finger domain-containing protein [Candidatus Methanofastidiosia archaeon]|jgi:zinc finger protein